MLKQKKSDTNLKIKCGYMANSYYKVECDLSLVIIHLIIKTFSQYYKMINNQKMTKSEEEET